MRAGTFWKMAKLEARHPGLTAKVDAMFAAFASIKAVGAMIVAEYGEHIGHTTLCNYRKRTWCAERVRSMRTRAKEIARREWAGEGRN